MSPADDGVQAIQVNDWLLIVRDVGDGGRVASAVQLPPKGASPGVVEGVRRRLVLAATGACPCGAAVVPPSREVAVQMIADGEFPTFDVVHADGCPASHEAASVAQNRARRRARKRGGR